MCLAVVAIAAHPRYRIVIAANRDEYHARPASPAHWWPAGMLAGRDLTGGGAWFGVTRSGRWALVTNFREGLPRDPKAPSRGDLVTRALHDDAPPLVCAAAIAGDGAAYHGFNLLIGTSAVRSGDTLKPRGGDDPVTLDRSAAAYASNRASGAVSLADGIHGLSNHLLDTPWPKLVRSKARLAAALDGPLLDLHAAFALLADRTPAENDDLPVTGLSRERERMLSSAFILSPEYGTRCSTVFTLTGDGEARLIERSFDPEGKLTGEAAHSFAVSPRREAAATPGDAR